MLKLYLDEKSSLPNCHNYEMSKKGDLGFSISYLFFLTYVNKIAYDVIVSYRLK